MSLMNIVLVIIKREIKIVKYEDGFLVWDLFV